MGDVVRIDRIVLILKVVKLILRLFDLVAQGVGTLRQLLAGGQRRSEIAVVKGIDDLADLVLITVGHDGLIQTVESGIELIIGEHGFFLDHLGRIVLLGIVLSRLALLARGEGRLRSLAKLVVEGRHDTHGIGRHEPIGTAANDGKDRDDDERLGDMTLVLVIGVLVGMHLALGFLSIVMQGNGRGNIDLGDTEILIESRQHAGLVRIGGVRKNRGSRGGRMRHLGIDLLLR